MAVSQQAAARELLHVVMLVMRGVAAGMRRSPRPLAPAQMASLMRIGLGPCTMSDLARHQAVKLPTISKSIDMLARRGWVERAVDVRDRRHTLVRLTPRGRRVLSEIKRRTEWQVAETLVPLAAAERTQLVKVLRSLARVLGAPNGISCGPGSARDAG